ncbi:MAG: hypothetical protein CSA84_02650 [Actinomycetales bacterium]|nr:MAG: hypothetical protein CSA84_02650 [Actinomycetales bacterium]
MSNRRGRVAVVCAVVMTSILGWALSACSGLPVGGPVREGRSVDERVTRAARIDPMPPPVGASPEQIVQGFLSAGAAFQEPGDDGELVAKSYLAPDSAERWDPTSVVTVYRDLAIGSPSATSIRAISTPVATVDRSGHYRELAPDARTEAEFGLVQIEGEWRLELPASGFGIWLNTIDFDRIYRPYRISYPVIGTNRLLPDVRWFPFGPRLITTLARAQVAPVPDYLEGVVESGFPEGTKLVVEAVVVDDEGVATVPLTASASRADVRQRKAMWAQLGSTLLAVPEVTSVTVEAQGTGLLSVPDLPETLGSLANTGYALEPSAPPRDGLLRTGSQLQRIDLARLGDMSVPEPTLAVTAGLPRIPLGYSGLAAGPDGTDVAARSPDRSTILRWRGQTSMPVSGLGTGLTRPAYDADGRLWIGGVQHGLGRIWVASAHEGSKAELIQVDWLQNRVPVAVSVSRDVTRLVIASRATDGDDPRVDVAGIVRDTAGRPQRITMPKLVDAPFVGVVDAVWMDDLTVAVLGRIVTDVEPRVYVAELGRGIGLRQRPDDASSSMIPIVPASRAVVPTTGPRGLVVLTGQGMFVRVGNGWRAFGDATELAVLAQRPLTD